MPRVVFVEAQSNFHLRAILEDGTIEDLNLAQLLQKRDSYWRLKNPRYFKKVGLDLLGAICWPQGEDLAPEGLYRYRHNTTS